MHANPDFKNLWITKMIVSKTCQIYKIIEMSMSNWCSSTNLSVPAKIIGACIVYLICRNWHYSW